MAYKRSTNLLFRRRINTMSNLYVYLMRSQNKDNKDIPNFKGRVETDI